MKAQFGGLINSLRSMVPLPSSLSIPSIPLEPSAVIDMIGDLMKGSLLPPIPSLPVPLPSLPEEWDKTIKDIMDGSPLPPALPSDLNGPYLSVLNRSALPDGLLPSEYAEIVDNIIHGSPLPADADQYRRDVENMLAGSAMPTRRMPSIPRDIPGMPSIDLGPYQDILNQLFDSVRGMFDGVEFQTKDVLKELADQGFEVPSIDPTLLMTNRDEYLAKIREQFQRLAERGIMDRLKNIRGELSDVMEGKKNFNISMADDYLDRLGGLVDPTGRLNSTLQGALNNISMSDVHDSLRRIGSIVSQQREEKFEKITSDFQFVASKMRERTENFLGGRNGSSVRLPPLPFLNQSLTMIEWSGNPYSGVLTSRGINSSVVSVMMSDLSSGNETIIKGLDDLINITLPLVDRLGADDRPECVFWNVTKEDWSNEGCRVQESLIESVVCGCNHLTDFAVAIVPLVIASASPSASQAGTPNPRPTPFTMLLAAGAPVASTSKDMRPLIGGVVGGVAGSVLLSIVAANMWDRRKKARLLRKRVVSIQNKNPVATMV